MVVGKVVGSVVATVKDEGLTGIKLLVVDLMEDDKPYKRIVAGDATRQAGEGDMVYLIGSKEASFLFRNGYVPLDLSVCGFVDEYKVEYKEN